MSEKSKRHVSDYWRISMIRGPCMTILWYFNWLFSHSSHQAMNRTDLAFVTGHLEGRIGWHFTLKWKVTPKIYFLHCVVYTYNTTTYHLLIWEVLEEVRRLVPDAMSAAQWILVAGWTLLLDVTWSSWFQTPLPSVQGCQASHWLNSWLKYHSIIPYMPP